MSESTFVLPGTSFKSLPSLQKLGPGLLPSPSDPTSILTTRTGVLHQAAHKAHVDSSFRRYSPSQNDLVIGQVVMRHAEGYRVDIGSSLPGALDALAFFNVNRKNKPNLQVGDLVYARVSSHIVGMEPELQCVTADNKAGGLGPLTTTFASQVDGTTTSGGGQYGYLYKDLSLGLFRKLLDPHDATLATLGQHLEYEVVVGMNGRIWVQSDSIETVVLVGQAITESEWLKEDEMREIIAKKIKSMSHTN